MPKGLIAGTLYLVTLERIKRHHAKKPVEPDDDASEGETSKWYQDLQEWMLKHPGGRDNAYYDPSEWAVRPMLVC